MTKFKIGWVIALILFSTLLPAVFTGTKIFIGIPTIEGASIPPPESHQRLSGNVLMIILDGLPEYVMSDAEYMPNMSRWSDHGAVLDVTTSEITLTGACTKELSTGRHSSPIDAMRNWDVTYDGKDDAFHYLLERNETVAFTGFYVWSNIFTDERFVHETVYDEGFSDVYDSDDKIIANVERWVEEDNRTLMLAHLGGTDHAGHIWGIRSVEYQEKMRHLDSQLESIRQSLPDDWTMLITADHGMTEKGGHAISAGQEAMQVSLLISGAGIKEGMRQEIVQRDIASIPIVLLNLSFPVSADSRIPLAILNITTEQSEDLEKWNWQAQVELQKWQEKNNLHYAEVDVETIDWDIIPQQVIKVNAIDITAFVLSLMILCYAGWGLSGKRSLKDDNTVVLSLVSVGYFALIIIHYVWYYDFEIFTIITSMWFRKGLGVAVTSFVILVILWYLFVIRRLEEPGSWNLPWWIPYVALAIIAWQPDGRLSPALGCLALVVLVYSFKVETDSNTSKWHTGTVLGILFISLWSIFNYLPHVVTGISLQQWTQIEFLYKFQQQLVHFFMTDNLLWTVALVVIGSAIAERLRTGEIKLSFLILAAPLMFVTILHSLGNSWTDRALIAGIAICGLMAIEELRESSWGLRCPCNAEWIELAIIMLIIPTWGAWPAMITLLLNRSLPRFFESHLEWLKIPAQQPLEESCRQVTLALIPWFLLCMMWTYFSLLTMVGLIEFNPTKVIVTGGFFGARVDPPILWMTMMITLPLVASLVLVLRTWRNAGFSLQPAMVLVSFLFATNIVNLWLVIIRPQVLLIIGFSTVVFMAWLICLTIAENIPGRKMNTMV